MEMSEMCVGVRHLHRGDCAIVYLFYYALGRNSVIKDVPKDYSVAYRLSDGAKDRRSSSLWTAFRTERIGTGIEAARVRTSQYCSSRAVRISSKNDVSYNVTSCIRSHLLGMDR